MSPAGATSIAGIDEDSLCNAIDVLFSRDDALQFEAIYEAAQRWPQLQAHFAWLLDGIALESPEAVRMRSHLEHERQLATLYQRPPAPEVDLPGQIRECLGRAEVGDWQGWWHLNVALARSPENPNVLNDLDYVIIQMPGWLSAEEFVRKRIVAGVATYLAQRSDSQIDSWLGRQPTPLKQNSTSLRCVPSCCFGTRIRRPTGRCLSLYGRNGRR